MKSVTVSFQAANVTAFTSGSATLTIIQAGGR